jgi:glycosyltransferase involved in cell wall biosynthesis
MKKNISIVIPAFNEELIINTLIMEIHKSFQDVDDYEIVLVDDGSNIPLEKEIDQKYKNNKLRILRNSYNIGQTSSIKIGIDSSKFDIIGLIDGDRQNPPSELRRLYDIFFEKQLDGAVSYREKRKDNNYKIIVSKLGNAFLKLFTKSKFKDLGSSIKVVKKECLQNIKLTGDLHRFIVPMLEKRNYKLEEFPTKHNFRETGKSNYGINRLIPVFVDGILFYLSNGFTKTKRYAVGKIAFILFFLSIIFNIIVIYQKVINNIFVHRNPIFIISMMSFILSIFIFAIGILVEKDEG